jgi:hypothetical protein
MLTLMLAITGTWLALCAKKGFAGNTGTSQGSSPELLGWKAGEGDQSNNNGKERDRKEARAAHLAHTLPG